MKRLTKSPPSSIALFLCTCPASAGPLNPPAGPVMEQHKTLSQMEPRTPINTLPGSITAVHVITQSGSYYLTADVVGEPNKHGIEIVSAASALDASIDLRGFAIRGVPTALDGIHATATQPTIAKPTLTVQDGRIIEWLTGEGLDLSEALTGNFFNIGINNADAGVRPPSGVGVPPSIMPKIPHFENVHIRSVTTAGFAGTTTLEAGAGTSIPVRLIHCSVGSSSGAGFIVGAHSILIGCTADSNAGHDFNAGDGCSFSYCIARHTGMGTNTGSGFSVDNGCTLEGCVAQGRGGDGFTTGAGCRLTGCTSTSNTSDGFMTGVACSISHCTASNNLDDGFQLGADNTADHSTANDNGAGVTPPNGGHGYEASSGCVITSCIAEGNGVAGMSGNGFQVGTGSAVSACTARANFGDGVRCAGAQTVVSGCTCTSNGNGSANGAGIRQAGNLTGVRVEGNHVALNDFGIVFEGNNQNICIRNSAFANPAGGANNYILGANTVSGQIVNAAGPIAPNTSAFANFSY